MLDEVDGTPSRLTKPVVSTVVVSCGVTCTVGRPPDLNCVVGVVCKRYPVEVYNVVASLFALGCLGEVGPSSFVLSSALVEENGAAVSVAILVNVFKLLVDVESLLVAVLSVIIVWLCHGYVVGVFGLLVWLRGSESPVVLADVVFVDPCLL